MFTPTYILDILNVLGSSKDTMHLFRSGSGIGFIVSCIGNLRIQYVEAGETKINYYYNLNSENIILNTDANTSVTIIGKVTEFNANSVLTPLDVVDVRKDRALEQLILANNAFTDLDVSLNSKLSTLVVALNPNLNNIQFNNPNLKNLDISYDTSLVQVDLSKLPTLEILHCDSSAIDELDISNNEAINNLIVNNCQNLATIKCKAYNQSVADAIAQIIQDNTLLAGTVYCNPTDTYYSTIETAANTYGWNILPLLQ